MPSLTHSPPPPPSRLPPARIRPRSQLDAVCAISSELYDNDGEFRGFVTSLNGEAVSGDWRFDRAFAARKVKEVGEDRSDSIIIAMNEKQIANKFEYWLRRHNTPEIPMSRSARLKALAYTPTLTTAEPSAEPTPLDASIADNDE